MRAAILVIVLLVLNGCSVVAATALAPIIGEIAKPVVEGIVEGLRDPPQPR
jgi:hypothetical protein